MRKHIHGQAISTFTATQAHCILIPRLLAVEARQNDIARFANKGHVVSSARNNAWHLARNQSTDMPLPAGLHGRWSSSSAHRRTRHALCHQRQHAGCEVPFRLCTGNLGFDYCCISAQNPARVYGSAFRHETFQQDVAEVSSECDWEPQTQASFAFTRSTSSS